MQVIVSDVYSFIVLDFFFVSTLCFRLNWLLALNEQSLYNIIGACRLLPTILSLCLFNVVTL